jgi:hypothetical protein
VTTKVTGGREDICKRSGCGVLGAFHKERKNAQRHCAGRFHGSVRRKYLGFSGTVMVTLWRGEYTQYIYDGHKVVVNNKHAQVTGGLALLDGLTGGLLGNC